LDVELRRVFCLQLAPGRWPEEDRHGVVLSAELDNLLDDFGGDSHVPIVLVNFCCKELGLFNRQAVALRAHYQQSAS
jgi:hypothetical protein